MAKLISDEQYFQLLEGLLEEGQRKELLEKINDDPELKAEWELWQMTVQTPSGEEEKYEDKEALLAIADFKVVKGVFWYRLSGVAALLVLGFVSFWMLRVADHWKDSASHHGSGPVDSFSSPPLARDTKSQRKDPASKVNKQDENRAEVKAYPKKKWRQTGNALKQIVQKRAPIIEPNLLDTSGVQPVELDTFSKPAYAVVKTEVTPEEVKAEVVYGSPISKKEKRRRKLLNLRTKAKGELTKWIEKPQLGLAKSDNKKKGLELKNTKFKIGIKP